MGKKEHFKAALMLPGMVLLGIPVLILLIFEVLSSDPNSLFQMHVGLGLSNPNFYIPLVIAFVLIGGGLYLLIETNRIFARIGEGTLSPLDPTKKLVIAGPFKYVRNPMFIGVYSILWGECLLFGSPPLAIWSIFFMTVNHLYVIFKEEVDLEKKFGQEYLEYKKNVPRWIPRLK